MSAKDQVGRLLKLVPWLHGRDGVRIEEAAAALGVSPAQVVKDLKVLLMVGLPGGYPDDLIDVDLDAIDRPDGDGVIRISNADYLARPMKLSATEATAVMVALLALRAGADDQTREIVDRTLGKLQDAAQGAVVVAPIDPGADDGAAEEALRSRLEKAIEDGRQVRIVYWVPARDEETERVVDPRGVVRMQGARYLDAWCHSAEADRLFRLDRIVEAEVLEDPVTTTASPRDLSEGLFASGEDSVRVTLRLQPAAWWMVEYYQVQDTRQQDDGSLEVDLLVADERWLRRLLLRLMPHAQVLAPARWADAVTEDARAVLRSYPDDGVR
jgi:proteasome accessory factor C